MQYVTLDEVSDLFSSTLDLSSTVFLYPTDTIYGLWWLVTPEVVSKIKHIKQRQENKHFSIIAPSFDRVQEYFFVDQDFPQERQAWYDKYGPLTILCERKYPSFLSFVSNNPLVGIRFLHHPFQGVVSNLWEPFLTTSANISGEVYDPHHLENIFAWEVDYFVTSNVSMTGCPSTLVNYNTKEIFVRT